MLKLLLVPLDGSVLAEVGAHVAEALAAKAGAAVTLVHVLEKSPPASVHGQRHLATAEEAQEYLQGLAGTFPPGVEVSVRVVAEPTRKVAQGLAERAEELQPDLIVLCAHGEVRLRDRLRGNIGQQVAGRMVCPVLLLPGAEGAEPAFPFRTVLVPLDGQPEHERGLQAAVSLVQACGAEMVLLTVVPTPGAAGDRARLADALLPAAAQELVAMGERKAAEHLEELVRMLRGRGLKVTAKVARGEPSDQIVAAAGQTGADLIVLGTHGRAGADAFWAGTLTPKLLRRLERSFLLVPAAEE